MGWLRPLLLFLLSIYVGYETWLWFAPEDIWDFLLFLVAWSIIAGLVNTVVSIVLAVIAKLFS